MGKGEKGKGKREGRRAGGEERRERKRKSYNIPATYGLAPYDAFGSI
jgi:hypothetical protein